LVIIKQGGDYWQMTLKVSRCSFDDVYIAHIVRYASVSLSLTLSRNEKVEQHVRNKTHKPNALRFWVEGSVISLYGLAFVSFLLISPILPFWIT